MQEFGSGPTMLTGAPAYQGMGQVKIIKGKILSVDKVRWKCTVQGEMDNQIIEGVPIMPPVPVGSEGTGSFYMPEVDSIVLLAYPSTEKTPFILGGATLPNELDEDEEADPNDFRTNRPSINEGDHVIHTSELGGIFVRKGGIIEIGASQAARRFYLPLQNMIKEFFENWEIQSPGGSLEWLCRRDDDTHGEELTPVEFRMRIREFCQGNPLIDIGAGRIQDEDDEKILFTNIKGRIVARIIINNRFRFWVDKDGAVQSLTSGLQVSVNNGPRTQFDEKTFWHQVKGLFRRDIGIHYTNVRSTDTLIVGRGRDVQIGGNLVEFVKGSVDRQGGPARENYTSHELILDGPSEVQATNRNEFYTGGRHVEVGLGEDELVVSQTRSVKVGNATLNGVAYETKIVGGEYQVVNQLGGIVLASNGASEDLAAARIVAKLSTSWAGPVPPLGTVKLDCNLGATKLEINASGFKVHTAKGAHAISLDAAGTVELGPVPRGGVVTTNTHPFDFMTGLPIKGSTSVRAGSLVFIGAPGPAAVATPSTFTADLPVSPT
jgi:hypothetical protein